jgi:hypothetical protein
MSFAETNLAFRLVDIMTTGFEVFGELPLETADISIAARLDWSGNRATRTIVASLRIEYHSAAQAWLSLNTQCHFEIEQQAWESLLNAEKDEIKFPVPFLVNLGAITVGTARGIIFEKTLLVGIAPYLLPLLDAGKLLADNVVWDWR